MKLFEIKLILVVIFTRREVLVVCGEVEGSHGPVEVSGPSTSATSFPRAAAAPHAGTAYRSCFNHSIGLFLYREIVLIFTTPPHGSSKARLSSRSKFRVL